jgi:hypothetical protein
MSSQEYHMVADGWLLLILFLTMFWFLTLRRLETVLKEHLSSTRSHQAISGLPGLFRFVIRGEYNRTGDERLVSVCNKLRKLLYGYLGVVIGYIVFLVLYRSSY